MQQRLVIIGAGFAGLYAALSAPDDSAEAASDDQDNFNADLLAFIQA